MTKLLGRFRDARISNKIVVPFLLMLVVLVGVTAPLASSWVGKRIQREAEDQLKDNRRAIDLYLSAWEDNVRDAVNILAVSATIQNLPTNPEMRKLALLDAARLRNLDYIAVRTADGQVVSVGGLPENADGAALMHITCSLVKTTGGWGFAHSGPTGSASSSVTDVSGGRLLTNGFLTHVQQACGNETDIAFFSRGEVIGTSKSEATLSCNGCHASHNITPSMKDTAVARLSTADMANRKYIVLHAPLLTGTTISGTYSVLLPMKEVESAKASARDMIFGVGLLLVFLVTAIGTVISRSITRPMVQLAEVGQDIAAGNLSREIPVRGNDEVGRLASSMSIMTRHLAGQLQELRLLHQLSLTTNSFLDLDDVLETLLESAIRVLGADTGSIMLVGRNPDELETKVAHDRTSPDVEYGAARLDESRAEWVVKHHQPLLLSDDLAGDAGFGGHGQFDATSAISVPIETQRGVIGVLNLNLFDRSRRFDQHTLAFASTLANHTAMAIERAGHYHEINVLYAGLIRALASTIDAKDRYTFGHYEMVTRYALLIGSRMRLESDELKGLEAAAYLHDIGKIGLRDSILTKPGLLTVSERKAIEANPEIGARILEKIVFPWPVVEAVHHHHERWDGRGYPSGLHKEAIPPLSRILSVADSLDAMTSNRPYRSGRSLDDAFDEIKSCSGTQFDPDVVAALMDIEPEVEAILHSGRNEFPDSHTALHFVR